MAVNSMTKRKASLGVNFEHGSDGAVVVYDGDKEIVIAFLPKNYCVNVRTATAVAVYYREHGKGKPLTVAKTKVLLDRMREVRDKPVIIGREIMRYTVEEFANNNSRQEVQA